MQWAQTMRARRGADPRGAKRSYQGARAPQGEGVHKKGGALPRAGRRRTPTATATATATTTTTTTVDDSTTTTTDDDDDGRR